MMERGEKSKSFLSFQEGWSSRQGPDTPRDRLVGIWDVRLAGTPASVLPRVSMNSMGYWKNLFDFTQPDPPHSEALSVNIWAEFLNHPCFPSAQFHSPSTPQLLMDHMGHHVGLVDAIPHVASTSQYHRTLQTWFKGVRGSLSTAYFGGRKN